MSSDSPDRRHTIKIAALLVDIDGTLVDSTATVERHWRTFASWYDLDPEELLRHVHGRRSADVIASYAELLPLPVEAAIERHGWLDLSDQAGVTALPGARRLLDAAPTDRLALVTSAPRPAALARLAAAGLSAPPHLVTAEAVKRGKPGPDPYQHGARLLNRPPSQCLAIEDAPVGLLSATDAGCQTLGLLTTHVRSDLAGAMFAAPDLGSVEIRRRGDDIEVTIDPR